jgi:hypothetical protein
MEAGAASFERPPQPPAFAEQFERRGQLERRHARHGGEHVLRHPPRYVRDEFVPRRHQLHGLDKLPFVLVQVCAGGSVCISQFMVFHR